MSHMLMFTIVHKNIRLSHISKSHGNFLKVKKKYTSEYLYTTLIYGYIFYY